MTDGEFFFGRAYDLKSKQALADKPVYYDPADLTTHAVITGMTGSGKTGMGIILLEEAALQGIPAILIDPKGDLTNHLLHFPDLLPSDFEPWVDADAARRAGQTTAEAAQGASSLWQKGLADWGIGKERIQALADKVDYAIYTPGSDSGFPVSILASLECPDIPWEGNKELLRERIASTVTALLELMGFKDIDPVRSREHILLSNIFESAWSEGKDLDLESLIMQIQSPPFEKLGVFPLSKFYPEKERFDLAMTMNNFLAAPAFQSWLEGAALDIQRFLYTSSGKPRHSIFYLAHLSDSERMFFITLLYSTIETWMRTQSGTSGLRAIVYFDEIVGYLPPIANPPSKPLILRMLKQARAFGVGLVLATQNPIDLDYKALSNAGTWMIGKLQTDQDKQRLLDGLEGLTGGLDRAYFDKTISELGKRVFLLHNVHSKAPVVYTTRWAMNYLAGPITRDRLSELNALVGAGSFRKSVTTSKETESKEPETASSLGNAMQPVLSSSVVVQYLPVNRGLSEALGDLKQQFKGAPPSPKYFYKPAAFGQATLYYADRTYNVDHEAQIAARVEGMERRGLVRWEDYVVDPIDFKQFESGPLPEASFGDLVYPFDTEKNISDLSKDFVEWIYRTQSLKLLYNDVLKIQAEVGESPEAFKARCEKAAKESLEDEVNKVEAKYDKQKDALEVKLRREELELDRDKKELSGRRLEEAGKGLENVMKIFGSGKANLGTSVTKRRMTANAKAKVEESEQEIEYLTKQLAELEQTMADEVESVKEKLMGTADSIKEVNIALLKKNILLEKFGLVWVPYYAFESGKDWITVPAYK